MIFKAFCSTLVCRRQQLAGVGLHRSLQYFSDWAGFDHQAIFHDQHMVGHGADHRNVVGDQQVTQAALSLQTLQQCQHLFLNRHIQRTGGLVQHQDVGFDDQRSGNRQPLPLTAGKLMRVAPQQGERIAIGPQPYLPQAS